METHQNNEINQISERVDHLIQNDLYFAHLSIYNFAKDYCRHGTVMDAGSGSGYGASFLADQQVKIVWGCEIDEEEVALSKLHFQKPNLDYRVMDLQNLSGFPHHGFDLIISSNVLEHLPNVSAFFHSACKLLKPDGILIVAVPPITREVDWHNNIANSYHLNIWTPRQWLHVISQYMHEVQPYFHGFQRTDVTLDFNNAPEQTVINEQDFLFKAVSVDEYDVNPSLTAIFLAKSPHANTDLPDLNTRVTFVDESFTRQPVSHLESSEPPFAPYLRYLSSFVNWSNNNRFSFFARLLNRINKPSGSPPYYIASGPLPYFMYGIDVTTYTNLGPMHQGQCYYQRFVGRDNGLTALSFLVATYCKQIDSLLTLRIFDSKKKRIIRQVVHNTESFADNNWQRFEFEPIPNSKDEIFWFSIETDARGEDAITLWTNRTVNGICQKNDQDLFEVICFKCHYDEC